MSRLAICDRCGMEMGDSFAVPLTRLTTHLNSSTRFFYEGDLCNDCIDEVVSFIKIKPEEVRHAAHTAQAHSKIDDVFDALLAEHEAVAHLNDYLVYVPGWEPQERLKAAHDNAERVIRSE